MKSRTVYAFCKKWYWFAFWQHWLIFQSWPLAIYYSCNYSYWILQKQLFRDLPQVHPWDVSRRYIHDCDATRKSDRFDTNLLHLGSPYLIRIFNKIGRVSNLPNQGFEEFSKIFSQNSLKSDFLRFWYPTTSKTGEFSMARRYIHDGAQVHPWELSEINDFSEILIPWWRTDNSVDYSRNYKPWRKQD